MAILNSIIKIIKILLLVLETTTMVSKPISDRKTLDLQKAESCTAWIMSFVAKFCAEKKEDKGNTDGTIGDLQVTNLFLSKCGQDALLKLRSLMSPNYLLDTPFKEIRKAIQNYISPKERVETQKGLYFCPLSKGLENLTTIFYLASEKMHVFVTSKKI